MYFDRLETIHLRVAVTNIANSLSEALSDLLHSAQEMSTIHDIRGTSLLELQENLNAFYFSCRDAMRAALANTPSDDSALVKAQLQRDFEEELRNSCGLLASGLSEEYVKIAGYAVNRIQDIVFSSGEETLAAEIRDNGPYEHSRLSRLVDAQTESCLRLVDNASSQWTIDLSSFHDAARTFRLRLLQVAEVENSALSKGKRKATATEQTSPFISTAVTTGKSTFQEEKNKASEWAKQLKGSGGGGPVAAVTATVLPVKGGAKGGAGKAVAPAAKKAKEEDAAPFDVVQSAIQKAREAEERRKAEAIAKLTSSKAAGGKKK